MQKKISMHTYDSANTRATPAKEESKLRTEDARWALIIGAGGIGSEVVSRFTSHGLDVSVVDPAYIALAERVKLTARQFTTRTEIQEWLECEVKLRKTAPSIVVFALGMYQRTSLENYDEVSFERCWDANFNATFWYLQALIPHMVSNGGGRIILVTSQAGAFGGTDGVYAAAKAACNALSKSIAREYAGVGIRINCVSPGPVKTLMSEAAMPPERIKHYMEAIPVGRFTNAAEVAAFIEFLALGEIDAANGATFDIDGGLFRR